MKRLKFFALVLAMFCTLCSLCGCKDTSNSTETNSDISDTEGLDPDYFLPSDEDANESIIMIPNSNQSNNTSIDNSSSGVDELVFGETTTPSNDSHDDETTATSSDDNQIDNNLSDNNESNNDSNQDGANSSENESSLDDDSLAGWNKPVF